MMAKRKRTIAEINAKLTQRIDQNSKKSISALTSGRQPESVGKYWEVYTYTSNTTNSAGRILL